MKGRIGVASVEENLTAVKKPMIKTVKSDAQEMDVHYGMFPGTKLLLNSINIKEK